MPPSYSPCPRPCLKRSSNPHPTNPPQDEPSTLLAIDPSILSPLVRFPPHTALAHTLGNALPYDRSPIVVLPNRCALPARGCPGRTYEPDEPSSSTHTRRSKRTSLSPVRGKHIHPRAVDGHDPRTDDDPTPRQSPRVDYHPPLPPLIPDLSSESSEESDGVASPPPELYHTPTAHGKMSLEQSLMNLSLAGTNAPSTSALSFLPHPPSPRVRPHHSPNATPSHSPSNSTCYVPSVLSSSSSSGGSSSGLSNPNGGGHHYRPSSSPVRSRSPAPSSSPTHTHTHRRKTRPAPIPIPSYPSSSPAMPMSPSAAAGAPASPERERRSRHRDESHRTGSRDHRDREKSRERRERERAERLARYKPLAGFGVDDAGCLGGF